MFGFTAKSEIRPEKKAGPIFLNFNPLKISELTGFFSSSGLSFFAKVSKEVNNRMPANANITTVCNLFFLNFFNRIVLILS